MGWRRVSGGVPESARSLNENPNTAERSLPVPMHARDGLIRVISQRRRCAPIRFTCACSTCLPPRFSRRGPAGPSIAAHLTSQTCSRLEECRRSSRSVTHRWSTENKRGMSHQRHHAGGRGVVHEAAMLTRTAAVPHLGYPAAAALSPGATRRALPEHRADCLRRAKGRIVRRTEDHFSGCLRQPRGHASSR